MFLLPGYDYYWFFSMYYKPISFPFLQLKTKRLILLKIIRFTTYPSCKYHNIRIKHFYCLIFLKFNLYFVRLIYIQTTASSFCVLKYKKFEIFLSGNLCCGKTVVNKIKSVYVVYVSI